MKTWIASFSCNDCHNGGTRLDFDALGYTPRTLYNGEPLCAGCHEDKSEEWPPSEFFIRVHEKHVRDNHIDCISCHLFIQIPGDFDSDGDVDGSDLAVFAADFGRTDCSLDNICEGDFESDGDVNGSDLATFAANFGRTN